MNKAELLKEVENWQHELAYYDDILVRKKCPTPKGVKKHIDKLYNRILKLMATNMSLIKINVKLEEENNKLKMNKGVNKESEL